MKLTIIFEKLVLSVICEHIETYVHRIMCVMADTSVVTIIRLCMYNGIYSQHRFVQKRLLNVNVLNQSMEKVIAKEAYNTM